MHQDTDYAAPGHRRIGGQLLIRSEDGDVLLVRPSYKPGWIVPGGGAKPGEGASAAARREAREELGLDIEPQRLLVVDHVEADPETGSVEGFNFVFDGGTLPEQALGKISLPEAPEGEESELSSFAFVHPDWLHAHCQPYHHRRIAAALAVLQGESGAQYLESGSPPRS
ncbi:NUDIX domain-containing protein [Streptomyces cavernicola]|uniref:NUDIX domain-containing protein n=1 Tax=Streptomyces cavernicola TaxID=3043613 RepID=A0ABT6SL46_9ACTN|nr:NUDIX domain-containing protein [Streptomyces sp. B-S-A6]MDI3408916.1 NUDIX domain-containing protein [Streptomyces sp. B-S-A6]